MAVYRRDDLHAGMEADGPALIAGPEATTVITPAFRFRVDEAGNIIATRAPERARRVADTTRYRVAPRNANPSPWRQGEGRDAQSNIHRSEFEIFKNLFVSIAEEMGVTLCRTAFSPNIKERLDYSCAIYDAAGETIAQGDHMPVHLGAMPLSVRAAIEHVPMEPGDVVMLNDPFRGGTHLPDITLVSPVFLGASEERAAGVLRREPRASCRRRRHEPGLDAAGARDVSGRVDHPADQTGAARRDCCRRARADCWPTCARPTSARATSPRRLPRIASPRCGCARSSRSTGGSASRAMPRRCRTTPSACCVQTIAQIPDGEYTLRGRARRRRVQRHGRCRFAWPCGSRATARRWISPAPIRRPAAASTRTSRSRCRPRSTRSAASCATTCSTTPALRVR